MDHVQIAEQIDEAAVAAWLKSYIANVLGMEDAAIKGSDGLDSLGLDSALTTALAMDMEGWLGIEIPRAILFEAETLDKIAEGVTLETQRQQVTAG